MKNQLVNYPILRIKNIDPNSDACYLLDKLCEYSISRQEYLTLRHMGMTNQFTEAAYLQVIKYKASLDPKTLSDTEIAELVYDLRDKNEYVLLDALCSATKLYRSLPGILRARVILAVATAKRDSHKINEAIKFGKIAYKLDKCNNYICLFIGFCNLLNRRNYTARQWLDRAMFSDMSNKTKLKELHYMYKRTPVDRKGVLKFYIDMVKAA